MSHAPAEVEPKTPWWFPVIGAFLLLGVAVYLLTSDDPTNAAPATAASAHP